MKPKAVLLAVAATLSTSAFALSAAEAEQAPTSKQLMQLIKQQQAQIEALKVQMEETDKAVEHTLNAVESDMNSNSGKTHVGGYGELHYNNIEDTETFDFHRFVLFFGHEFNDNIRFYSELELEHAFIEDSDDGGSAGEVELEQAFIEIDLNDHSQLKSGVFLLPVGIMNETHEPPAFYGVERNPVEKNIIPATWWESGAMYSVQSDNGLNFDFAVHSGLSTPTDGSKSFLIRSGRTKASKAPGNDLAYTARVKYAGVPGLELAASFQHQADITQGALGVSANLFTAHAVYQSHGFGLKALYANWQVDGDEAAVLGRDEQSGYYIEPAYKFNEKFGVFARYGAWDNNAGNSADTEKKQTNVGLNYWPHENVVFKFDLENRSGAQDGNGFNLGVGYQF